MLHAEAGSLEMGSWRRSWRGTRLGPLSCREGVELAGQLPCAGSPIIKDFLSFVLVSSVILLKRGDTALAQPTAPPQSL